MRRALPASQLLFILAKIDHPLQPLSPRRVSPVEPTPASRSNKRFHIVRVRSLVHKRTLQPDRIRRAAFAPQQRDRFVQPYNLAH